MKKITILFSAVLVIMLTITGCLKDTKFNNHEYGIKDPAGSPDGVGFTLGRSVSETRGLEVTGTTQSITDLLILNLFAESAASSDINVTLVTDTTLVRNFNTANGTSISQLPPSIFNLGRTQFTIKAGKRLDTIPFNLTSTLTLDPNKTYGVGFRITSASGGTTIASNYSTIVLQINIKNKYDGRYRLRGFHNRPGLDLPYSNILVYMITTGPNSVKMFWPSPGPNIDAHPINGGATYYGTLTTEFFFNATTNALLSVNNPYTPGSPPFTVGPATTSRYDPASKTIYAQYYYNANLARMFTDTLVYTGPR